MKTRLLLLLLPVLVVSCRAGVSNKLNHEGGTACSNSLTMDYRVWLPEGYSETDREYPLLVWLHGGGENEYGWGREGRIGEIVHERVKSGELQPFVVVSPSYGMLTPVFKTGEKLLIEQVLPEVRRNYRVNDVTVAFGHSMGGLSALIVSMRNPGLFSAVIAASPFLLDTTPWDTPEQWAEYEADYGSAFARQWRYEVKMEFDSREEFAGWDPFSLARAWQGPLGFELMLTVGDKDPMSGYPRVRGFHGLLLKHGIEHEWYVQAGNGHGTVEDPLLMDWLNERAHGDGP